ncbi:polysaccharide deacetylase family protein [Streptomyces humi]|uniref:polysaccharide deacetylase family protein n=1 Tax=Streptomyces humi TaxID=1428620 RepID=UPI0009A0C8C9|nr:polysaccharide deacetylase family protein [Streptomyces humi]
MRAVVQNDKNRSKRGGVRRSGVLLSVLALSAGAVVCGCAGPQEGPDVRPAAGQQAHRAAAPAPDSHAALVAAARRWGLDAVPLRPPAPPKHRPRITARDGFEVDGQVEDDLPPVFTTIPTRQKVVFLTIDDGANKDPAFLRMMSELKIPYSAFLSNYLVKDDYGFFRRMQAEGHTLNNHTLTHPYLPGLSYEEQKHEICGMQSIMEKQFGRAPTVFRPPYGNYNGDTLRAAKACGIKYAPIWDEEVFVDHWEYRDWDRSLHPGDIVLTHFRGRDDWDGTMVDDMRRFLNKVTRDGYAVARLEDYL